MLYRVEDTGSKEEGGGADSPWCLTWEVLEEACGGGEGGCGSERRGRSIELVEEIGEACSIMGVWIRDARGGDVEGIVGRIVLEGIDVD